MSNTPGISPLTPDIEKIRQSDDVDDEIIEGENEDLFDDPAAGEDNEDEAGDGDLPRLEEHDGLEPGS